MPPFDIILVNYESTACLLRCLRTLYGDLDGSAARVIVVDNGSREDVTAVTRNFPAVELVRNRRNLGFAKGVNHGLARSEAPFIVILNPDTILHAGFFKAVSAYMEAHPDVGLLGPKLQDKDGSIQASARSFPTPLTAFFGRTSYLSRVFPTNRFTIQNLLTTRSDGASPMDVDWVSGACMVARREAVQEVGLLDERFFMYWEDADWCRRMWAGGWRVVYFPQASAVHFVGASSERRLFRSVLEFHKSSYRLFKKYSRPRLYLLKPAIVAGLAVRICCVLTGNGLRLSAEHYRWRRNRRGRPALTGDGRPIRIVRLIARLNIGGPAIHVHLLSKGLNGRRFRTVLVTGRIPPTEGDMSYLFAGSNVPVVQVPELQREIRLRQDARAFLRICRILLRERPHIVHTHTAKAGTSGRLAALLCNLFVRPRMRLVHTFHGHVFEGYFRRRTAWSFIRVERLLGRLTDAVIAISPSQKRDLVQKYRIAPENKVTVLPLGFDLKPFLDSAAVKGKWRRSLGVDGDTLLIGIIGRLVPVKNHALFFEAARLLKEHLPGAKVMFVAVGDGELRSDLERLCAERGLAGQVRFCGWLRDLRPVYADLDILALTSLNEGTPVSIIEAMAAGVPVIATDVGGVRDLVGGAANGENHPGFEVCEHGLLCRSQDAPGFAAAMAYVAREMPAAARAAQTARARAFVAASFSEQRLLADMKSLYRRLLD